jgi:hypothetical protein
MVSPISAATPYGREQRAPHVVNVELTHYDFLNISTMGANFNDIPHPGAYDRRALNNVPATLVQRGYLGYKAAFDIGPAMQSQGMSFIQSVYIDNSEGLGVLILRANSGQTVTVAPCTQGMYPLILPAGANTSFECVYLDPNGDEINTVPSVAD